MTVEAFARNDGEPIRLKSLLTTPLPEQQTTDQSLPPQDSARNVAHESPDTSNQPKRKRRRTELQNLSPSVQDCEVDQPGIEDGNTGNEDVVEWVGMLDLETPRHLHRIRSQVWACLKVVDWETRAATI